MDWNPNVGMFPEEAVLMAADAEPMSPSPSPGAPRRWTIPQAGVDVWHERLRDLIKRSGRPAKDFGPDHGILDSALQKHANPNYTGAPSLSTVYAVAKGVPAYPAAQQLRDLFGLEPHELEIRLPAWEPRVSTQRLLDTLRDALGRAHETAPSVYEIAETVHGSCLDSAPGGGDIGRWRTRVFDVPAGYHFRYLQAQAVEFERGYPSGITVETEPDPGVRAEEYIGQQTRGVAALLEPVVKTLSQADRPHPTFLASEMDPATRLARWRTNRLERAELIMRMGTTYGASPGEWVGRAIAPLLPLGVEPTGRHIWLTPTATSTTATSDSPLPIALDGVCTLVFVGAPSVAYRRIGYAVARALGWGRVSSNEVANRVTGRRVAVSTPGKGNAFAAAFEEFARDPMPQGVLAVHMDNLFRRDESLRGSLTIHPEALRMLTAPGVLPILLLPRPESRTMALWEERQGAILVDRPVSLPNQEEHIDRLTAHLLQLFAGLPRALTATVLPSFPWSGPTVEAGPGELSPHWYIHPLIGDFVVRASYEIARFLRNGTTRDPGRPTGFASGSMAADHEPALRACTGGDHWADDDHLDFDPRYLGPATEAPRRGRVTAIGRSNAAP
jgi:hypothetical protein